MGLRSITEVIPRESKPMLTYDYSKILVNQLLMYIWVSTRIMANIVVNKNENLPPTYL